MVKVVREKAETVSRVPPKPLPCLQPVAHDAAPGIKDLQDKPDRAHVGGEMAVALPSNP